MRTLLRPTWLVRHVLVVTVGYVMVRLAMWQWGRGAELHAVRNYSYALEWYAFALLSVVAWVKLCRDELVPDPDAGVLQGAVVDPLEAGALARADQWDDDPEVAEWNARFRELHLKHALTQSGLSAAQVRARLAPAAVAPPPAGQPVEAVDRRRLS